ncbi:type VII secretion protein EccB [Nocardia exalbida]|uniref:type VII secretion protein EccB n=1 Tax=Nocardia exalbida TaxID=290231 RepID=UPI000A06BAFD|nr:type VII secretion protein EccB [Nocardia exalbida]
MPSKPTTRWQVSGYRFLVRRMEHALVRRDVRMLHDPMRSQSRAYAAGLILACVVLAGCGVLALIRPQNKIDDNKILIGKESGQVYAVIGGVVHPALNLASARLAVGDPAKPVIIKESELSKKPRGLLLGIPGAPSSLNFATDGKGRAWTVCDELRNDGTNTVTNTVIAGSPVLGEKAGALAHGRALLVQGRDSTYLIYDNRRARVDMADRAVTDALGIRGMTPRRISEGLLNAIPEVPAIVAPKITDPGGSPLASVLNRFHNGDVVKLSTENQYFVVLREGLQAISPLTAAIVRNANPVTAGNNEIQPFERTLADMVSLLPVAGFPDTAPTIIDAKDSPVACLSWQPLAGANVSDGSKHAELTSITGKALPIPDTAQPVRLAQADSPGSDKAAQFYATPGSGFFVQTTGIEPDSQRRDSMFFVADTGVRYGIADAEAQKALGMDAEKAKPELAPWAMVGLLASGPRLARTDAMVAHDGVSADAHPAKSPVQSTQN